MQYFVPRLYLQGPAQVGNRVLVCTAHKSVGGQAGELAERRQHLFRRAFEQAPTTRGKECVSTEKHRGAACRPTVIGNMPGGVARNVEDVQCKIKIRQLYRIAFRQKVVTDGQALGGRAVYWCSAR